MTTPPERPEWDTPAPNAGCQQGHPLIEFHSTDQAKDCPLCAAIILVSEAMGRAGAEQASRADQNQEAMLRYRAEAERLEQELAEQKATAKANFDQGMAYHRALDAALAKLEEAQKDLGDAAMVGHMMGADQFRAQRDAALARVAKLEEALTVAKEAMDDRRAYCMEWNWKYGESWDAEDALVEKALGGGEEEK